MPEKITSETLLNNIVGSLTELQRQASGSSYDDMSETVSSGFNRLFGREKPIHHIFGGGKCKNSAFVSSFLFCFVCLVLTYMLYALETLAADVLLWRNKKISASVLGGATVIWVLFEWLNYNLLTILCFLLVLGMVVQFGWSNASGFLSR